MTNKLRFLATASALTMCATAAPAWAQDSTPVAEQSDDAQSTQDIVVTGTRVVRDGYEAPTPVTVMSTEDIQNSSPSNNIADVVNQLPSMAGSTKPANSRLNLSSGQAGINALNLRNLGETRTLILLDGRRSVASTVTNLVDINTIPQMLVNRVEVVTGGASAAYGSDAVAGVVNFVLDRKYEGLKVEGDIGVTTHGDGFNYSVGAAGGTSFADGRGHIIVAGEMAHQDGIFNVDRDWNHTGYVRIQDPNWTASSTTPRYLIRRGVGASNSTPGGLITDSTGGVVDRLRGIYFGLGGQVLQYQYGELNYPTVTSASAPSLTQGGDWRVNDSGRRIGLNPRDDRHGIYGRASFEVSDGVELFAEAAYNQQEVYFNAGPNLWTGITLRPDNPYLVNALGAATLAGIQTVTLATTAVDLPFRGANNERKVQRYAIGAEGQFDISGKEARWDVYGQYGRAELREQLRNIMHVRRRANAIDAVTDANGNIVCRINADADATNNDAACVPLNLLGIGVADPNAINYMLGDPYRDETIEQYVAGANLSFQPFATWAGDVSFALGAEYRKEKIKGYVPEEFQPLQGLNPSGNPTSTNLWSVGNYLPTNGKYSVKEAYLETVVPLGFGLEFNGAIRATDYSTSGYVTTWKAGATWQPIEDIRLRITRSRDIRAPNLNELYQAGSANSDSVSNPAYTNDGANGPASFGYSGIVTGNPNLDPEKADSWNIGGVLSPRFLPGFNMSVDYFRINLKDAIDTISAQEIVNRCHLGLQQYCDAISEDPERSTADRPYLLIRSQPFNFARRLVRGIDLEASYTTPIDRLFGSSEGNFSLRGVATRYIENYVDSGIEGTVPVNTVGVNGGQYSTPKWIYRLSATYSTPRFSMTGVGRGVSKGKYSATAVECQTSCPLSTIDNPTYDDLDIKGTFYVDLNLTAKVGDDNQSEFFINITNVFDKGAMLLPETGLAANSTFSDLLGRTFRVGFRAKLF